MNVAKFEYNLGNIKDCENQSTKAKKGHSKKVDNYNRFFQEKWTMMLEDKN